MVVCSRQIRISIYHHNSFISWSDADAMKSTGETDVPSPSSRGNKIIPIHIHEPISTHASMFLNYRLTIKCITTKRDIQSGGVAREADVLGSEDVTCIMWTMDLTRSGPVGPTTRINLPSGGFQQPLSKYLLNCRNLNCNIMYEIK